MAEVALSSIFATIKAAYNSHMDWKFFLLEEKARQHDLTVQELVNSDSKCALFMRLGRAFELCSQRDVIDYLADAMVGMVKLGAAENKPDFAQICLSSLSGVTKLELDIILLMRRHSVYLDVPELANANRSEMLVEASSALGLEPIMLAALCNGLARTGLVCIEEAGIGGSSPNTNKLTPLARELFQYVDYAKNLSG
ncbi:hypothetical protein HBJ58_22085 [Halomonas desiderata]|uniref:hypothetical protein n=1 Tax=Billgrantia desiderata TaxID=52021 RepID=UPI00174BCBAC|nr:hypothetical protein [Halomonas desiderata]